MEDVNKRRQIFLSHLNLSEVTFLLPSPSLMRKLANNYNGGRSEDPVTQPNHVTNFSSDVMLKSEKPLGTRLRLTCDAFFPSFLL